MKYLVIFVAGCFIYLFFLKAPREISPQNNSANQQQPEPPKSEVANTNTSKFNDAKNPLANLSLDYPKDTALIMVRENPITEETCNLFKSTSKFNKSVCINNKEDWKVLCENANGATNDALQIPAKQRSAVGESKNTRDALIAVAQNGGASFISSKWTDAGKYGECQITVRYSGLYQGTSVDETLVGANMKAIGISSKEQKTIIAE